MNSLLPNPAKERARKGQDEVALWIYDGLRRWHGEASRSYASNNVFQLISLTGVSSTALTVSVIPNLEVQQRYTAVT